MNITIFSWHLSLKNGDEKFLLLVWFVSETQLNFEDLIKHASLH